MVSGRGERRVGEPGLQPSRVCGSTGQLRLGYSHGVLTIDEPADMPLDGKPPATSGRMRLQAMSEERAERIDGGCRSVRWQRTRGNPPVLSSKQTRHPVLRSMCKDPVDKRITTTLNQPTMKKLTSILTAGAVCSLVNLSNAQSITSFVNLDFESGVVNQTFNGFDNPAHDIPGWSNHAGILDAGVEGSAAWWGTYAGGSSAFINGGGSAYNLSDYTIQAGDLFSVSFVAKSWPWTSDGIGEWTVSLFYDAPANVFGSYTTSPLGDNTAWVSYSSPAAIAATGASEGGKLGILFLNTGGDIATFDGIEVAVVPEPSTVALVGLGWPWCGGVASPPSQGVRQGSVDFTRAGGFRLP